MTEDRNKSVLASIAGIIADIGKETAKGLYQGILKTVSILAGGGLVGAVAGGALALIYGWPMQLILWGAIAGAALALVAIASWHAAGSLW